MTTVTISRHDAVTTHPALGGSSTPTVINIVPHSARGESRAAPSSPGIGPEIGGLAPAPLQQAEFWTIRVVGIDGASYSFLTPEATIGDYSLEINGIGSGSVSVPDLANLIAPIDDSGLLDIFGRVIDGRALAVYYGGSLVGTFIPIPGENGVTADMQGPGPGYHPSRKYVGRINAQPNYIDTGEFNASTDINRWDVASVPHQTKTWDPSDGHSAPGSMVLDCDSAGSFYVADEFTFDSLPYETFLWITGWAKVVDPLTPGDSPTNFVGIYTQWSVGSSVNYAAIVFEDGVALDWTRAGVWQKVTLQVYLPADQVSSMQLQLAVGNGVVKWDDITIYRDERLYVNGGPEDVITLSLVNMQDPSLGKPNLGFVMDTSDSSGEWQGVRAPKYMEPANILDLWREMASIEGGVNWLIEEPQLNQKVVHTMPPDGLYSALTPVLTWGFNMAADGNESGWNIDKSAGALKVIGRGEGDEHNEGVAINPDSLTMWETVVFTSIEATVDPGKQAAGMFPLYQRPVFLTVVAMRAPGFEPITLWISGDLKPGRIVMVNIERGYLHVHEEFIIVSSGVVPEKNLVRMSLVARASILAAEIA